MVTVAARLAVVLSRRARSAADSHGLGSRMVGRITGQRAAGARFESSRPHLAQLWALRQTRGGVERASQVRRGTFRDHCHLDPRRHARRRALALRPPAGRIQDRRDVARAALRGRRLHRRPPPPRRPRSAAGGDRSRPGRCRSRVAPGVSRAAIHSSTSRPAPRQPSTSSSDAARRPSGDGRGAGTDRACRSCSSCAACRPRRGSVLRRRRGARTSWRLFGRRPGSRAANSRGTHPRASPASRRLDAASRRSLPCPRYPGFDERETGGSARLSDALRAATGLPWTGWNERELGAGR
jgi:hypothetical protein